VLASLDDIRPDSDLLKYFEDSFNGFQKAARMLPPRQVMDRLLGNVAIVDGLRRRAPRRDSQRYFRPQARYAEPSSWLSEEAGDLPGAMYWIDLPSQWAQAANRSAMTEYGFVRRSMMVVSFSGDGRRAIDQAQHVFGMSRMTICLLFIKQHAVSTSATEQARFGCWRPPPPRQLYRWTGKLHR
jgi:hypothetical protein